jgi:hypothetical protein
MTNSPWAKEVTVSAPAAAVGGGQRPASSGTDVENPGARGGRGGRSRSADEDGGPSSADVMLSLNVSWRSALPLRKALVKSRLGAATQIPAEAQQMLSKDQQDYIIVVSGIPARMGRLLQDSASLKRSTVKIGKKAPITPTDVTAQSRTQSVELIFAFPKSDPATLDDKDAEVDFRLGQVELKKKFTLKEMVYNGKLEL